MKRIMILIGILGVVILAACAATSTYTPSSTSPTLTGSVFLARNSDGAETVLIPSGSYTMGAADSDTAALTDEKPLHAVTLSAFYIYKQEVTNSMYGNCVAAGACPAVTDLRTDLTDYASGAEFADYPVVGVDWNMADAYCTWVGGRLPTEAEWEAAARGMEGRLYPWGSDPATCDIAGMQGCSVKQQPFQDGSFARGDTPLKLRDMGGNVWEWVNDWFSPTFYSESPSVNPVGPWTADTKVVRGGGWDSPAGDLRSTARLSGDPYLSFKDVGFRCVANPLPVYANFEKPKDTHTKKDGCSVSIKDPACKPDDKTWKASWGWGGNYCPDEKGSLKFTLQADNNFGGTYQVTVNGDPATCLAYSAVGFNWLDCVATLKSSKVGDPIMIHGQVIAPDGSKPAWAAYDKSTKVSTICSKPDAPADALWDIVPFCPDKTEMTTQITSSLPYTLTKATIQGVDMSCFAIPYGNVNLCTNTPPPFPLRPDGTGYYSYHVEGVGGDGKPFAFDKEVDAPVCSTGGEKPTFTFSATCQGASPAILDIRYTPSTLIIPLVMDTAGTPLSCAPSGPGEMECSGGFIGSTGDMSYSLIYLPDGSTPVFVSFSLPAPAGCAKPPMTEKPLFSLTATCDPKGGYLVTLEYVPVEIKITGVYDKAFSPLTCTVLGGGEMKCNDTSGDVMLEYAVGFKYPSGDSSVYYAPDFAAPTDCTKPPVSEGWKLSKVECVDGSATDSIDFLVDVPVMGSSFVYAHVEDLVVGTYSCASTSFPNQVYCLGARPYKATGDLSVQATYFDASFLNHSFSEWSSLLPKGTCITPTLPPPVTTNPCSQYTVNTCPNDNTCHIVGSDCVPY